MGNVPHGGVATIISGIVDIGTLRHHSVTSPWTNWAKDLRTELDQLAYEGPIYSKNRYADRQPFNHHDYAEQATLPQIELLKARGIWQSV